MNLYKIFLFVTIGMSKDIQIISGSISSEIRYNCFYENMMILQKMVNKLFANLKLNNNFNQSVKNRLLLTMHEDLMTILKNKYKSSQFENIADNKPINDFAYYSRIDEIIQEEGLLTPSNKTDPKKTIDKILDESFFIDVSRYLKQFISTIDFKQNALSNYNINSTRRRLNLKPWVPAPHSNEQVAIDNRRIFGSMDTTVKKYPFMASVHVDGEFVCAGAVIGRSLILTAASCLQVAYVHRNYKSPNNVTIRIGGETTEDGELVHIARIHFHPAYNPETLHNNLAILKAAKHKNLKKRRVRRILYDRSREQIPKEVKRVKMLGWGARDAKNDPQPFLKLSTGTLDLYDTNDCIKVYSKYYVSDSNFCAGFTSKGSGACNKDLGDPAIVAGVLVGVVSFGPPLCGTPDAPTVFTRIGVYTPWLDTIIQLESKKSNNEASGDLNIEISPATTTSEIPKLFVPKGHFDAIKYNYDYPEEMLILKEILKDITLSNQSMIDQIVNDGIFNKELTNIIETTTKLDMLHSPLINKTYFPLDDSFPIGKPFKEPSFSINYYPNHPKRPGYVLDNYWNKGFGNAMPLTVTQLKPLTELPTTKRFRHIYKNYRWLRQQTKKPVGAKSYDESDMPKKRPKSTRKPNFVGNPTYEYDYEYPVKTTKRRPVKATKPTHSDDDYSDRYSTKTAKRPPFVGRPIESKGDDYLDKKSSKRPVSKPTFINSFDVDSGEIKKGKPTRIPIPLFGERDAFDNYEAEYYEERGLSIEVTFGKKNPRNHNDKGDVNKDIFFVVEADIDGSEQNYRPNQNKLKTHTKLKNGEKYDTKNSFSSSVESDYESSSS